MVIKKQHICTRVLSRKYCAPTAILQRCRRPHCSLIRAAFVLSTFKVRVVARRSMRSHDAGRRSGLLRTPLKRRPGVTAT